MLGVVFAEGRRKHSVVSEGPSTPQGRVVSTNPHKSMGFREPLVRAWLELLRCSGSVQFSLWKCCLNSLLRDIHRDVRSGVGIK